MDVQAAFDAPVSAAELFAVVSDIERCSEWLGIVERVRPVEAADGDPGPAWSVDLRAQYGPLRRSKRLRMVRSEHLPPHHTRYERREVDGRSHSPWTMDARITAAEETSHLVVHLHYGGNLWVPMLDRLLGDEIERSRPRLLDALGLGTTATTDASGGGVSEGTDGAPG